jgi:DNA-directed RNA polymerase specialized sigma24 family protein
MASEGSVTRWIGRLKDGDPDAAARLWEGYSARLLALARVKLRGTPRRAVDEEDVALHAFDSFCRAAGRGQFARLDDRDDLWQLLALITARKAARVIEHQRRKKRGGGLVQGESALLGPAGDGPGLRQVVGTEPTPDLTAEMTEECRRLLDLLGDDELRAVAVWRMEGATVEEMATRLGCVRRSVDRKLRLIRDLWAREVES